ncbi:MAG TPA: biotin/lipoyl-containing protein [Chloroflexota bacterium]
MLYHVTVGDRTVSVRLRREGDTVFAALDDGQEQSVHLSTVRGPLRSLALGPRRYEVMAARSPDGVAVAIAGVSYRAEVLDETHARLASVAAARGGSHGRRDLKAPMPGLVVKVLVEPGQVVAAGQPLVVLQAMKMENELSLPRGGTVSTVGVAAGQTVEAGQVLASID